MSIIFFVCLIVLTGTHCQDLCRTSEMVDCLCYPTAGRILCANLNLHKVPSFVFLPDSYWYIDLSNNQLSNIQPHQLDHFIEIDLRGNPVDCLNPMLNQKHIKSDCLFPDITVKPDSVSSQADFTTTTTTTSTSTTDMSQESDSTVSFSKVTLNITKSVSSDSSLDPEDRARISLETVWLMSSIIIIVLLSVGSVVLANRLIKIQRAVRNTNPTEM